MKMLRLRNNLSQNITDTEIETLYNNFDAL